MDVRLLGPVEVSVEGRRLPLNGARPTAILAALVVHLGEVLSVDRLVDLVWEEEPPATARALVASHVSGLRRVLAGTGAEHLVRTRSPGYVADLPPSAVDARRFEEAFTAGRDAVLAGRAEDAVGILDAALGLWHGRGALEGLGQSFARVEAMRLAELRLEAQEFRFAAELDLDRRADLVAELLAHVAAHPLRERPRGQLMTALFRTGRGAEALRCYEEGRRLLRTELGVDPGPELRALHLALLRSDTAVLGTPGGPPSAPRPAAGPADPPRGPAPGRGGGAVPLLPSPRRATEHPPDLTTHPPAPSHLPPDVADFVGRAEQIDWATALLGEVRDPRRTAPPIGVISGRSGTGKTALAVHVAHRTAGLFPDGRLFVDLRASDSAPVRTADALARLLRALGVDPDPSPRDEEDLLGLYRTHIARRRVLLILDNAVNEALLRPCCPRAAARRPWSPAAAGSSRWRAPPTSTWTSRPPPRRWTCWRGWPDRPAPWTSPPRPPRSSPCADGSRSPCASPARASPPAPTGPPPAWPHGCATSAAASTNSRPATWRCGPACGSVTRTSARRSSVPCGAWP